MAKIYIDVKSALAKAKKKRKDDGMKVIPKQEADMLPPERVIEIDTAELGFDAAKVGMDDLIKLQFTGRVKEKADGKFLVSVDNIIVPQEETKTKKSDIIPSPSA